MNIRNFTPAAAVILLHQKVARHVRPHTLHPELHPITIRELFCLYAVARRVQLDRWQEMTIISRCGICVTVRVAVRERPAGRTRPVLKIIKTLVHEAGMSINKKGLHHSHVVDTIRVRIIILNGGDIGDGRENMAVKNNPFGICLKTGVGVADIKRSMSFIHQIIGHYPIVTIVSIPVGVVITAAVCWCVVIVIKKRIKNGETRFRRAVGI